MPTLKQLTCSIELGDGHKLKEYGARYSDGVVETFIPVPEAPDLPFSIHLISEGYIAPGLAMFVFIDGEYQCNRNKRNLRLPNVGVKPSEYEAEFRVRQKEEKMPDGKFIGREWSFTKLKVEKANGAPNLNEKVQRNLGTIEVVVLRCKDDGVVVPTPHTSFSAQMEPTRSAKASIPSVKAPSTVAAASVRAASAKAASVAGSTSGDAFGGMFGLFDGACDFGLDGAGDRPVGRGGFVNPDPPPGMAFDAANGQYKEAPASSGDTWDSIMGTFVPRAPSVKNGGRTNAEHINEVMAEQEVQQGPLHAHVQHMLNPQGRGQQRKHPSDWQRDDRSDVYKAGMHPRVQTVDNTPDKGAQDERSPQLDGHGGGEPVMRHHYGDRGQNHVYGRPYFGLQGEDLKREKQNQREQGYPVSEATYRMTEFEMERYRGQLLEKVQEESNKPNPNMEMLQALQAALLEVQNMQVQAQPQPVNDNAGGQAYDMQGHEYGQYHGQQHHAQNEQQQAAPMPFGFEQGRGQQQNQHQPAYVGPQIPHGVGRGQGMQIPAYVQQYGQQYGQQGFQVPHHGKQHHEAAQPEQVAGKEDLKLGIERQKAHQELLKRVGDEPKAWLKYQEKQMYRANTKIGIGPQQWEEMLAVKPEALHWDYKHLQKSQRDWLRIHEPSLEYELANYTREHSVVSNPKSGHQHGGRSPSLNQGWQMPGDGQQQNNQRAPSRVSNKPQNYWAGNGADNQDAGGNQGWATDNAQGNGDMSKRNSNAPSHVGSSHSRRSEKAPSNAGGWATQQPDGNNDNGWKQEGGQNNQDNARSGKMSGKTQTNHNDGAWSNKNEDAGGGWDADNGSRKAASAAGWGEEKGSKKAASVTGQSRGYNEQRESSTAVPPSAGGDHAFPDVDPKAHIQPYWADWRQAPMDRETSDPNTSKKRDQARDAYFYPARPAPAVPAGKSTDASHGVQAGRGAAYAHKCHRPEYLDEMTQPYAVFSFKYRNKHKLETILGRKVDADIAPVVALAEKDRLLSMPKDKLVEELMKMRSPPSRSAQPTTSGKATSAKAASAKAASIKNDWDAKSNSGKSKTASGWGEAAGNAAPVNDNNNNGGAGNQWGSVSKSKAGSIHGSKGQAGNGGWDDNGKKASSKCYKNDAGDEWAPDNGGGGGGGWQEDGAGKVQANAWDLKGPAVAPTGNNGGKLEGAKSERSSQHEHFPKDEKPMGSRTRELFAANSGLHGGPKEGAIDFVGLPDSMW